MTIGQSREDRYTNTEADAGAFERLRGYDDGYDDVPSPSDLAEMAEDDRFIARRRAEREAAARARGEYVPEPGWAMLVSCMSMTLALHGIYNVTVTPTRDGVARIDSPEPLTAEAVAAALNDHEPGRYEAREVEGAVWVKAEPATLGGFLQRVAPDTVSWDPGPPF